MRFTISKGPIALLIASLIAFPVRAEEPKTGCAIPEDGLQAESIARSLPSLAFGTEARTDLAARGVSVSATYIGEVLGAVRGGQRRGAIYEGRLEIAVDACSERLLGFEGGAFHVNGYQIHGEGLSRYRLGNLLTASSIEALPSTRLFELWVEQKAFSGRASLRVGQLAADSEFNTSVYAGLFLNSTFGWPTLSAAALPSGGPAFPLATPAARLRIDPTDSLAFLVGVFDGDPAGPGVGDPQRRNKTGTSFRTSDAPFLIGEAQLQYGLGALPGTLKLGVWRHFGRFADLRYGLDGLSLADPVSLGLLRTRSSDQAVYGSVDQLLFHAPGAAPEKGVGAFVRFAATPASRNPIDLYLDGGVTASGLVPGRPDDVFGIAASHARVSDRARGLDRDVLAFNGPPGLVRDFEVGLEASYQASIVPGWTVQPDVQVIIHPGANAPDRGGVKPARDALVLAVRSTIRY